MSAFRRLRRYGHVRVEAAAPDPEPTGCAGQKGWDSSTIKTAVNPASGFAASVSGDLATLTQTGVDWTNASCLSMSRCDGVTKAYFEWRMVDAGSNHIPIHVGLCAPATDLSSVNPENAAVAFAWQWWNDGHTELYVAGSPGGFFPAPDADDTLLMIAWDVAAGEVFLGQAGVWLEGDPSTPGSGISVSGSDLLLYTYNWFIATGAFTADDFSYPAPSGYTAWDGT